VNAVWRSVRTFWRQWVWQPQSLWLREAAFQVHLWTGIGAGLYILVIGVTGSAMVFRPEIYGRYWQTPKVVASEPRLTEEQLEAAARGVYPRYDVTEVISGTNPEAAVEVWLDRDGRTRKRWFDPYTGRDLGEAIPLVIKAFAWMLDLHDNLLAGETGRTVNGIGGLLLTVMCVTGAVIWWPGVRNWRRSLIVRRSGGWKRFNWSLHSAMGFWGILLVFVWGATGFYLVFQQPFMAAVDYFEPLDLESFEPRVGDAILTWLGRLHFGRFYGLPMKILYTVLGLALPVLFVTGALMWWNRVLRK
jgi:uncharacterized iron-regulated membrane protein